jgi:hypothetical protein
MPRSSRLEMSRKVMVRAGVPMAVASERAWPEPPAAVSSGVFIRLLAPSGSPLLPSEQAFLLAQFEIFDTANRHYPKRFRGRCIQHLRPVGAAGRGGACQCVFAIVRTNRWEDAIAFAIDLAWRVGGNMFKDYWPTFFHNMGLNRLKVIPDPSEPHGQGSR